MKTNLTLVRQTKALDPYEAEIGASGFERRSLAEVRMIRQKMRNEALAVAQMLVKESLQQIAGAK